MTNRHSNPVPIAVMAERPTVNAMYSGDAFPNCETIGFDLKLGISPHDHAIPEHNRETVLKYLKLMNYLDANGIYDTAIIDMASYHKGKEVREAVPKRGHKIIYLSPYSPSLNPIEKVFGHWKRHVY